MKKFISLVVVSVLLITGSYLFSCGKCEHSFVYNVLVNGTCTEKEVKEAVCVKCGEKETIEGDLRHMFNTYIVREATCSIEGVGCRACVLCNFSEEYIISTLPHVEENGRCKLCGRVNTKEFLPQELYTSLISEASILKRFGISVNDLIKYSARSAWMDDAQQLNIILNNGLGFKIDELTCNYESEQKKENEITSFKFNTDGIIDIYFDNEASYYNSASLEGFIINNKFDVFAVYKDLMVEKVGVFKKDKPLSDTSIFSYEKKDNGYYITGCSFTNATKLIIPATYNDLPVIGIKDCALMGLSIVEEVVIGENVISIGEWAFANCKKLKTVSFGVSVKKISNGCFYNTPLTTINYSGTEEQKEEIVFGLWFLNMDDVNWILAK